MSHDDPTDNGRSGALLGGRYHLIRLIGRGGMGRIYLAEDEQLGRRVALKILRESFAGESDFVERFRREAKAAAAIGHPNIVQVYDIGRTADGFHYLAMEALEGRDLRDELRTQGKLRLDRSVDLAGQILFALSAAHRAGIVHRDLKPSNIFLAHKAIANWSDLEASGRGETSSLTVKLLDFGISRFLWRKQGDRELTGAGTVLGTAKYMAPEQIGGDRVDGRADLYALGVILFECVTGTNPFGDDNVHSVMHRALQQPISDAHELAPDIPPAFSELLRIALSERRSDRYRLAEDFIVALRPFRQATTPATWIESPFELPIGSSALALDELEGEPTQVYDLEEARAALAASPTMIIDGEEDELDREVTTDMALAAQATLDQHEARQNADLDVPTTVDDTVVQAPSPPDVHHDENETSPAPYDAEADVLRDDSPFGRKILVMLLGGVLLVVVVVAIAIFAWPEVGEDQPVRSYPSKHNRPRQQHGETMALAQDSGVEADVDATHGQVDATITEVGTTPEETLEHSNLRARYKRPPAPGHRTKPVAGGARIKAQRTPPDEDLDDQTSTKQIDRQHDVEGPDEQGMPVARETPW